MTGVPEQGLTDALKWALDYIADGVGGTPRHDCEFDSNPLKGACDFHDRYWAARAALERPRPALPAATIHEIIRRIQNALPHGEHSQIAPLYPTWEAAARIFDALRLYFEPPYAGAALPAEHAPPELSALWDAILAYGAASQATGFDLTGKPDVRAKADANRRDCLAKVEALLGSRPALAGRGDTLSARIDTQESPPTEAEIAFGDALDKTLPDGPLPLLGSNQDSPDPEGV